MRTECRPPQAEMRAGSVYARADQAFGRIDRDFVSDWKFFEIQRRADDGLDKLAAKAKIKTKR